MDEGFVRYTQLRMRSDGKGMEERPIKESNILTRVESDIVTKESDDEPTKIVLDFEARYQIANRLGDLGFDGQTLYTKVEK